VSVHTRRSSGWTRRPLQVQYRASIGEQKAPAAERIATRSSIRAPETLLVTKSVFNAFLPLAAHLSSSLGNTGLFVISQH